MLPELAHSTRVQGSLFDSHTVELDEIPVGGLGLALSVELP